MKKRELIKLGIPKGKPLEMALGAISKASKAGMNKEEIRKTMRAVLANPQTYAEEPYFGTFANSLLSKGKRQEYQYREISAPYQQWGDNLDEASIQQMERACQLPVSVAGALMPDAHLGYGLPIGGVLAVRNAVIPYAVGVDIACRMRLTAFDMPSQSLTGAVDRLKKVLEQETRFGIGAEFKNRRAHSVMDEDWGVTPVTKQIKDKAWAQLGTSGSGNHFVEYGVLEVQSEDLEAPPGTYLALLSHSGSRGPGSKVAGYYSGLAMNRRPELPKELAHLSWLDLDSGEGMEYWEAMRLMGKFAAANHELIHYHIAKALGAKALLSIENHHNFAWKEDRGGETVIVHRKGATPAGRGVLGIIPGSMASPAYIVRGKGNPASLHSASHGAGRLMSRRKAKESFTWSQVKKILAERDVTVLSAGLDEAPMAYKNIDEIMSAQSDLVEPLAVFHPRIVKMAPEGERAED